MVKEMLKKQGEVRVLFWKGPGSACESQNDLQEKRGPPEAIGHEL